MNNVYYNAKQKIVSNNLESVPQQADALRAKIRTWEKRGYLPEGWVKLTESEPVYDDSLLTGTKELTVDEGGTTYSWTVGGVRWDQCVDVVANARKKCREIVDAAVAAAQAATIPYTLPAGSKLNNVDAAGTQVNLPAVHSVEGDKYWPNVALSMELKAKTGTMGVTERFGAVEGRIDIPADEVMPLLTMLLPKLSGSLTNRLDIEDQFDKAATAEEYDAIRLAIQG